MSRQAGAPGFSGTLQRLFVFLCIVFVAAIGVYAWPDFRHMATAVVATLAAYAVGALVGFIFGVPKARSDGTASPGVDAKYRPNTNLEQVSDWLTKIIVGVGLIQFRQIGEAIYNVGQSLGVAIAMSASSISATAFAISLLVASAGVSFLFTYMWTTTRLYDLLEKGGERELFAPSDRPPADQAAEA